MKIVEGNSYVCIKEWKDTKGRKIFAGTICYGGKSGLLCGYNSDKIYSQVEPLDDYSEYFTLYEESPYNKERRELRERYAGIAMGAIISDHEAMKNTQEVIEGRGLGDFALQRITAEQAISFADALIEQLKDE